MVKGEAIGLKPDEPVTMVAVKMIRSTADAETALESLVGELKIMIHLGTHLNVVNLMGACTDILKGFSSIDECFEKKAYNVPTGLCNILFFRRFLGAG